MGFCSIRVRKNMSITCKELKKEYIGGVAAICAKGAIAQIVRQRVSDWKLPVIMAKNTKYSDCLPPIFSTRREQVQDYLYYQFLNIIKPHLSEEAMETRTMYTEFLNDKFVTRILCLNEIHTFMCCSDFEGENDIFEKLNIFVNENFNTHLNSVFDKNGNIVDLIKYIHYDAGQFAFFSLLQNIYFNFLNLFLLA